MIQEKIFDLQHKTVLITVASSGIVEALANFYAQNGADLSLLARRKERIDSLAAELEKKYNMRCIPVQCDVSDEGNVSAAVQAIVGFYGKIDVLVNNAAITAKSEDIAAHTIEQWNAVLNTNLRGPFCISKEVVKYMKTRNYGKIINIASVCGMMGVGNQISYSASKSGIIGLTRSMAVELGKYSITVNAISPGYVLTEMTNEKSSGCRYFRSRSVLNTIGNPDDLFGTVLLLSSDASAYISGVVIPVDGGITANL